MSVKPALSKRREIPHFGVPDHLKQTMTARIWSKGELFRQLCKQQDVQPTVRQARKFFQKHGRWANARNRSVWAAEQASA